MLKDGDNAPLFELPADGGRTVRLKDYKGRYLVLYFYPKDNTSGCTKEAVGFSEALDSLHGLGADVLGLSPDSVKSHDKFKSKHGLTIDLASDEEKTVLQDYGVWVEKSMYGRKYMGVERSTFLIGPDGKIVRSWRKVKVPGHVDEVRQAIEDAVERAG